MSTEQPKAHGPQNPTASVSRRTFVKTVGAAVGTGAVGVGANGLGISPVGEADGVIATVVATGGLLTVGAAAGITAYKYGVEGDTSVDESQIIEDEIYHAAGSVATGRQDFVEQMQVEYLDSATGQSPYAKTAWSEIRATAAEKIVNGNGSEALSAAQSALQRQTTISLYNMIDRMNSGTLALVSAIKSQVGPDGATVIKASSDSNFSSGVEAIGKRTTTPPTDWTASETVESGGHILIEAPIPDSNLPMPPSNIEDIPDTIPVYALAAWNTDAYYTANASTLPGGGLTDWHIGATHSELSAQEVIDYSFYSQVLSRIETEYNNISSELSTYVDNLRSALNQGAMNASDIIAPTDLFDQFASTDKRSGTAAQLAAIGVKVPEDLGYQAQISHPELAADKLWVDLYPQFSGSTVDIQPDMTLTSTQYNIAYIGYTSDATGDYVTEVLSGDSDLEILDVANVEGSEDATESAPSSAASSGDINLGTSPPDQVVNPGDYQETYRVVVATESGGTYTAPVADVSTNTDGEYIVPASSTGLSGGESITSVRIIPVVTSTQTSQYVADATTVDSQAVQDQLQAQKDMQQELDKISDGGGDGFLSGGGLLGGGGIIGGAVLAGLGILGLGQLGN